MQSLVTSSRPPEGLCCGISSAPGFNAETSQCSRSSSQLNISRSSGLGILAHRSCFLLRSLAGLTQSIESSAHRKEPLLQDEGRITCRVEWPLRFSGNIRRGRGDVCRSEKGISQSLRSGCRGRVYRRQGLGILSQAGSGPRRCHPSRCDGRATSAQARGMLRQNEGVSRREEISG